MPLKNKMKSLHLCKALGWLECLARLMSTQRRTDSLLLDGLPGFAVPAVLFAKLFDKPVMVLVSEEDLKSFLKRTFGISGRLLRRCDYVVVKDEAMKQVVSNRYDIKARKVIVLPYEVGEAETGEIKMAPEDIQRLQSLLNGDN